MRQLAGRSHAFAHNGSLRGLASAPRLALQRFHPEGETDSEYAFCALLARLQALWPSAGAVPPLRARLQVIADFAAELRELGPANFFYADGDALFAHGHQRLQPDGRIAAPGLQMLTRTCRDEREPLLASGLCVGCGYQQVTLLASVPLSNEPWQPLAEGETLAVVGGQVVARQGPGHAKTEFACYR